MPPGGSSRVAPSGPRQSRARRVYDMTWLALAFSLLIVGLGVMGLVSPPRSIGVVRAFATPGGLYFAAAVRIVMGTALYLAAPDSRAPELLRVLGVITLVVGFATPLFGLERFLRMVDWWSAKGPALIRTQGAFAVAVGLLLAWVLLP